MEVGCGDKIPALTEDLMGFDSCWEGGMSVLFNDANT